MPKTGQNIDDSVAFDVWSDGMGKNVGWMISGGRLYSVDLMSGKATMAGTIAGLTGRTIDLAILPSM